MGRAPGHVKDGRSWQCEHAGAPRVAPGVGRGFPAGGVTPPAGLNA
jgi:hypothetical protein